MYFVALNLTKFCEHFPSERACSFSKAEVESLLSPSQSPKHFAYNYPTLQTFRECIIGKIKSRPQKEFFGAILLLPRILRVS
jgi:hypothetical protein